MGYTNQNTKIKGVKIVLCAYVTTAFLLLSAGSILMLAGCSSITGQQHQQKDASDSIVENSGADCDVTFGKMVRNENLPNPFEMNDGSIISTMDEWKCRRNEIKKDLEKYEIGPKPESPAVEAILSGDILNVKVTTDAGSITLSAKVSGSGSCVYIPMSRFGKGPMSGCTTVSYNHDDVALYGMMDHKQSKSDDKFYTVYPELWQEMGDYAIWSWGVSRIIDGLEQVADELNIDTTKIAVHGCSYAGKMALQAGALDERVALTIAQESGGGGIPSWRLSQNYTDRTGKNVEKINNTDGSWFKTSMKSLDPYNLPHDHHELIAMIAPRAFVALGNPGQVWLADESGYKSVMAAREVWKAMGIEEKFGFDFSGGHGHCQLNSSQAATVQAFAGKFLHGENTDTNIAIAPKASDFEDQAFDDNCSAAIDWVTPTILNN